MIFCENLKMIRRMLLEFQQLEFTVAYLLWVSIYYLEMLSISQFIGIDKVEFDRICSKHNKTLLLVRRDTNRKKNVKEVNANFYEHTYLVPVSNRFFFRWTLCLAIIEGLRASFCLVWNRRFK